MKKQTNNSVIKLMEWISSICGYLSIASLCLGFLYNFYFIYSFVISINIMIFSTMYLMIFIFQRKYPLWLKAMHAFTWMTLYPFEKLWYLIIRSKYKRKTPLILNELQEKGLIFHLVFGTLLFAYRNNNFGDNDIDICIFRNEFNSKSKDILKECGFVLKEEWYLNDEISEQTYINKKYKISMDIFFISRKEEFAPTFDEKNNRYARRPRTYKYDLAPFKIKNNIFMAPKNIEEYLTWNYNNWRESDPDYDWFLGSSKEPSIIVENANIKYKKY